ncbi:hypothetical protein PVAG01_09658 [Phlyctema vagabunda]|uniref:Uncharacterized protein n=1 Tax=Phlyctema vagabunda TaxID=108571 RepID=A0ABR4P8M4_9HELO
MEQNGSQDSDNNSHIGNRTANATGSPPEPSFTPEHRRYLFALMQSDIERWEISREKALGFQRPREDRSRSSAVSASRGNQPAVNGVRAMAREFIGYVRRHAVSVYDLVSPANGSDRVWRDQITLLQGTNDSILADAFNFERLLRRHATIPDHAVAMNILRVSRDEGLNVSEAFRLLELLIQFDTEHPGGSWADMAWEALHVIWVVNGKDWMPSIAMHRQVYTTIWQPNDFERCLELIAGIPERYWSAEDRLRTLPRGIRPL